MFKPQDHFEDLTYSPDFPTVGDEIAGLYKEVGGDRVDGVLALDPYALAALLTFTGPVSVPGPIPSSRLQMPPRSCSAGSTRPRRPAQSAMSSVTTFCSLLWRLRSTGSRPVLASPETLAMTLSPQTHQGRLLFWSRHPDDQPLLERLGLEGAFPRPGSGTDVSVVTVANAANNKIDEYLKERVVDSVHYDPVNGKVASTVTISLENTAPDHGLPKQVIGSYSGSDLAVREQLYLALGIQPFHRCRCPGGRAAGWGSWLDTRIGGARLQHVCDHPCPHHGDGHSRFRGTRRPRTFLPDRPAPSAAGQYSHNVGIGHTGCRLGRLRRTADELGSGLRRRPAAHLAVPTGLTWALSQDDRC